MTHVYKIILNVLYRTYVPIYNFKIYSYIVLYNNYNIRLLE